MDRQPPYRPGWTTAGALVESPGRPARLPGMDALADPVERVAADAGFSSVVPVDRDDEVRLAKADGLAHRGWALANTIATRFAIASGTKGLTALSAGQTMPDTDSGHQGCSG